MNLTCFHNMKMTSLLNQLLDSARRTDFVCLIFQMQHGQYFEVKAFLVI